MPPTFPYRFCIDKSLDSRKRITRQTIKKSMNDPPTPLYADHSRSFRENKFVYPVLSRRSKGISIGVNLNPDKICNFDCIYCQVNRRSEAETRFVETERLMAELDHMFSFVKSGAIYDDPQFIDVPTSQRRLNDVAFSGDGEPTTFRNFDTLMTDVAELKKRHDLDETKMVLITNASMFHRPVVKKGLEILNANNGEVWAKLDAGTEAYYHEIERTTIPYQRILDNITSAAQTHPLAIQSLFMNVKDVPPSQIEIAEFGKRLKEILSAGGRISYVQVYTVARPPAESFVSSLSNDQVDSIASHVREATGLRVEVFYGNG